MTQTSVRRSYYDGGKMPRARFLVCIISICAAANGIVSGAQETLFVTSTGTHFRDCELLPVAIRLHATYIDHSGRIVIPPIDPGSDSFSLGSSFHEGLAKVSTRDHAGYIDKTGQYSIAPTFDSAWDFDQGFATVEVNRHYGIIDSSGNYVVKPTSVKFVQMQEGLMVFWSRSKAGYRSRTGAIHIPARFDDARGFSEGRAPARVGGIWGFIDRKGNWIIVPRFKNVRGFHEGLASVWTGKGWGVIDRSGVLVVPGPFSAINPFHEGRAAVKTGKLWGFIDGTGRTVIPREWDEVGEFSEGLAAVVRRRMLGFIDRDGHLVVPLRIPFDSYWLPTFCGDRAVLALDGMLDQAICVDRSGKLIWAPWQGSFRRLAVVFISAILIGGLVGAIIVAFAARRTAGMPEDILAAMKRARWILLVAILLAPFGHVVLMRWGPGVHFMFDFVGWGSYLAGACGFDGGAGRFGLAMALGGAIEIVRVGGPPAAMWMMIEAGLDRADPWVDGAHTGGVRRDLSHLSILAFQVIMAMVVAGIASWMIGGNHGRWTTAGAALLALTVLICGGVILFRRFQESFFSPLGLGLLQSRILALAVTLKKKVGKVVVPRRSYLGVAHVRIQTLSPLTVYLVISPAIIRWFPQEEIDVLVVEALLGRDFFLRSRDTQLVQNIESTETVMRAIARADLLNHYIWPPAQPEKSDRLSARARKRLAAIAALTPGSRSG